MGNRKALNKRCETIAWGTGFAGIGILSLIPGDQTSIGLLGIGLILLGLNLARYFSQIPTNRFTWTAWARSRESTFV